MKIYVREGQATFICDDCGDVTLKHMETHIPHVAHKCNKCGFITSCELCYRSSYRKVCDIDATITLKSESIKYPVKILDMSLHGYRLKLLKDSPIKPGDELILEYELPSKKRNKISEDISIAAIMSDDVEVRYHSKKYSLCGTKCINLNPYSEQQKSKGFWLMP